MVTYKIRTYGRMELAQLYFPDVQPKRAIIEALGEP